ncbi:MAG: hypothetical protein ACI8QZ_003800 [Chlamydiales bacterium]
MLEGRRADAVVAAALALVVGVAAVLLRNAAPAVAAGTMADPAASAAGSIARGRVALPVDVAQGRASVSADGRGVHETEGDVRGSGAAQQYGSIEGVVHDALGYPDAHQVWVFRHRDPDVRERRARSGMHGNFELRDVEAGSWEALYCHVHPSVQVPMLTVMTKLEVSQGEVSWVELGAPDGTRSLYGEYVVRVDDASHEVAGGERVVQTMEQDLDLELRPASGAGAVTSTGRARVVSFPGGFRAELAARDAGEDDGRPALRKGAFFFGGLEPGHYVLRIVPTGNERVKATFDGGDVREIELGIERAIDLVLGDVVLAPEVFSMVDDFVHPALEREAAR